MSLARARRVDFPSIAARHSHLVTVQIPPLFRQRPSWFSANFGRTVKALLYRQSDVSLLHHRIGDGSSDRVFALRVDGFFVADSRSLDRRASISR